MIQTPTRCKTNWTTLLGSRDELCTMDSNSDSSYSTIFWKEWLKGSKTKTNSDCWKFKWPPWGPQEEVKNPKEDYGSTDRASTAWRTGCPIGHPTSANPSWPYQPQPPTGHYWTTQYLIYQLPGSIMYPQYSDCQLYRGATPEWTANTQNMPRQGRPRRPQWSSPYEQCYCCGLRRHWAPDCKNNHPGSYGQAPRAIQTTTDTHDEQSPDLSRDYTNEQQWRRLGEPRNQCQNVSFQQKTLCSLYTSTMSPLKC